MQKQAMIALRAPVSADKMAGWVKEEVDRMRGRAVALDVWLGPLARPQPAQGGDWVIEVDLEDRDMAPEDDVALASILLDLELLGLRPQLMIAAPLFPRSYAPEPAERRNAAT